MNQKGAVPVLVLIAIIGLIAFLAISSTFNFKSNLFSSLFPKKYTHAATPNDWNQVQKSPQRTGFSSEIINSTNLVNKTKWCTYAFQPERIYPQVQAIIYGNVAFVGTEMGNLYAIDGVNCTKKWSFKAGGSILASAAADLGKVYFGSLDGAVYALDSNTGLQLWKTQLSSRLGFSTAPILAEGKVMLGGRDGKFYALDPNSGAKLWEYNAEAPILMTAAWDQGKAFFGTMDMFVHGVNTADGTQVWKSAKIKGMAFKDYWPVVTAGKVIVQPWGQKYSGGIKPGLPFGWYGGGKVPGTTLTDWQWLSQNNTTIVSGNALTVTEFKNAQDNIIASYQANPANFTTILNILDETTGQKTFDVPNFDYQEIGGAPPAPCVDKDGKLIIPTMFVRSGWGRLDLTTQRITDVLYDGNNWNGQPMVFDGSKNPAGMGNNDEDLNVSCSGNGVFGFHMEEGNANYTGFFDLVNRKWTQVAAGWKNGGMFNNTQGGGGNPPSVSNGRVYHIAVHELIVRNTN